MVETLHHPDRAIHLHPTVLRCLGNYSITPWKDSIWRKVEVHILGRWPDYRSGFPHTNVAFKLAETK